MANHALLILVQDFFDDDTEAVIVNHLINMYGHITADGDEGEEVIKMKGYVENIVPRYPPDQFRRHYRISRDAFDILLQQLTPHLTHEHSGGLSELAPENQLLLFCWYMANQDSFRQIGHQFDVAISTVHQTIHRLLDIMIRHMRHLIKWPTLDEQQRLSHAVEQEHGIRGLIGYIDGTHIRLQFRPKGDQDYINRKKYPSVQLQVVVDANLRILSANTGWPGCAHDARVLRNSILYQKAEARQLFGEGMFILGDSAYPQRSWLITCFKDNGRMTLEQRAYNRKMASLRQVVERAIGHLKCRFRKVRDLNLYKIGTISKVITVACIMHNLCIVAGDELADFIERDMEQHPNQYEHMFGDVQDGFELRNRIVQQVMNNQ